MIVDITEKFCIKGFPFYSHFSSKVIWLAKYQDDNTLQIQENYLNKIEGLG